MTEAGVAIEEIIYISTTLSNPDKQQIVTGWLLLFDAMFGTLHSHVNGLSVPCQTRGEQLREGGRCFYST